MSKNYFITIEGIEGVGKSTLVSFLQTWLKEKNISLCATREPGGTEIAEDIRQILLHKHTEKMASETELLLMFAARAQHLATVIKPALEKGQWVLCDRFTDASYAYQGGGRGIPDEKIKLVEECVQDHLNPDLTILLDAPVELALKRAQKRSHPDRFESEQLAFFERVRNAYLKRAKQDPKRFRIIDATKSEKEVEQDAVATINQTLFAK